MLRNIGNESVFKINTTDKSRRFKQYFGVYFWENLFPKYMNTCKNLTNLIQVCESTLCFSQPRHLNRLI